MRSLENIVEPYPLAHIVGSGVLLAVLPLGATWVAVGWVDAVLVALSVAIGGATAAAVRARHRLDHLPLELAPVAARGRVDGRDTVRFRACLGRGRSCRPRWTVTFQPDGGPSVPLPASMPVDHVCGPFVAQVEAPDGDGRFEVAVTVGEETARRDYAPTEVVVGRFCPGILAGRRLRFDDGWRRVEPDT